MSEDVIVASGGIMPNLAYSTPPFRFHVDVPDDITSFTIRQTPIANAVVAEPSATALVWLGLVGPCFGRWMVRKAPPLLIAG